MKNEFQDKVKKFMDESGFDNPVEYRMIDLVNEVGEVGKEIAKMSEYGMKKPEFREEIRLELGDAFYSLITVANYYNVDLLESLDLAIQKYERRIRKGGHAGSENE